MSDVTFSDAINAYDGGVRSTYGDNATAGIFSTFPNNDVSTLNCFFDQVSHPAGHVCVCVCVCVRACVRACVRVGARACALVCLRVTRQFLYSEDVSRFPDVQ